MLVVGILLLLLLVGVVKMVRRPRIITFTAIVLNFLLIGVVIGPTTGGIRKAQDSAAMQTCRTIALAEFQYANDMGSYPSGSSSTEVFKKLLDGNYVSDSGMFYLRMRGKTRATDMHLKPENVCYDVTSGVDASAPDGLPVVFATGYRVDYRSAGKVTELDKPHPVFLGDWGSWEDWLNFEPRLFFPVAVRSTGTFKTAQWSLPGQSIPAQNSPSQNFDVHGHVYRQLTPDGVLP